MLPEDYDEHGPETEQEVLAILQVIHRLGGQHFPGYREAYYRIVHVPVRSPQSMIVVECVKGKGAWDYAESHPLFRWKEVEGSLVRLIFESSYDGIRWNEIRHYLDHNKGSLHKDC